MPLFSYKAINTHNEIIEDIKEAVTEQELVWQLQEEGLTPINISSSTLKPGYWLLISRKKNAFSIKEIINFTHELATLLDAGLPLDRSLSILLDLLADHPKMHTLVNNVLESVKEGKKLSEALKKESDSFSTFYISTLRAGEEGGNVAAALKRISQNLEETKELKDSIITKMTYPCLLLVVAVISVFYLLVSVVPTFNNLFDDSKNLSLLTEIVISCSVFLQKYWSALAVSPVFIIIFIKYQLLNQQKRQKWDELLLKTPIVGEIILNINIVNFSRTLATLLENGVSLQEGLTIANDTINNQVLAKALESAKGNLQQGVHFSKTLVKTGIFPTRVIQMIEIGEETGSLEDKLDRVASIYSKELTIKTNRLLTLLEPLLIIGLSVVIAFIIAAILSAIFGNLQSY